VIHFAGLKAVGESVQIPLAYYENNIGGTLTLGQAMAAAGVKNIVFSSSATVYGDPASVPIRESFPRCPPPILTGAPNSSSKRSCAIIHVSDPAWNVILLRYFNPVGAHPSGLIGEDPNGIPNNLMPFVAQVAIGKLPKLRVFGNDYPTPDGTGVRDYIHVVDLARGHLAALNRLAERPGAAVYNLGTGRGYSVLEMVAAFERASGRPVPYEIVDRRPGDIATCYADPSLAREDLGWQAKLELDDMVRDSWRWQSQNPNGFA
jgi:UDP-glucose 4-epimerase